MATLHKLFVYGTLKRGFYNYRLFEDKNNGRSFFIGEAILNECWPLVVGKKNGIPYLLRPQPSCVDDDKQPKNVYGEFFEVDDSMLAVLDELEQCPTWYSRTQTTCKLLSSTDTDKYQKGSSVSCYVYTKTDPEPELYSLPFISNYTQDSYVCKADR